MCNNRRVYSIQIKFAIPSYVDELAIKSSKKLKMEGRELSTCSDQAQPSPQHDMTVRPARATPVTEQHSESKSGLVHWQWPS